MTRLMVSVRNASEAAIAIEAGADLIDVKEPLHGALGAASRATMTEVLDIVGGRVPVSLALGELLESSELDSAINIPAGASFLKVGLAGCESLADWPERWMRRIQNFRTHEAAVAV